MADQQTRDVVRSALTTTGVGTAALLLAAAAALPAFADSQSDSHAGSHAHGNTTSGHNPPGNNGTVFIHDVAGDQHPHNVPHVGCTFYVDFFGFDAGQDVTVSFAGQAPTGKGTALGGGQTLSPVSTDDAGGAGQDWDNEITVTDTDLGVTALGTPAHEGYHIKMTVDTNQPGGHKYKVFWLQPCTQEAAAGTESSGTETSGTETSGTESTGTESTGTESSDTETTATATEQGMAGQSSGAAIAGPAPASAQSAAIPTQVLGRQITRKSGSAAAPAAAGLPFTGAEISGLAAAAIIALGGGLALTVAGRRRRSPGSVSES